MCNLRENLMTVPPGVVSGERRERVRLREMRERMHRPFLHIDPGPAISFLLLLLLLTRASLLSIFFLSSALTQETVPSCVILSCRLYFSCCLNIGGAAQERDFLATNS